jgi:Tfp pilus assembly protein PilN
VGAWISVAAAGLLAVPGRVEACATCFGASDSPMAQGMNLGILSLLGVIVAVLFGLVCFFSYLAIRARRTAWLEELKDEVEEELERLDGLKQEDELQEFTPRHR